MKISRVKHSLRQHLITAVAALVCVLPPMAAAAGEANYQALRDWIAASNPAQDSVTAGQHLGLQDRSGVLEALIPQTAWQYYFFDDMDMEMAASGHYPPPPEWGKQLKEDYRLDERGVLIGFNGGGYLFPDVSADDPQAAVKVIWNMLWRPGQNDYDMPMVTWMRGAGGKLDRKLEYTSVNSAYAVGEKCLGPGYEEVKEQTHHGISLATRHGGRQKHVGVVCGSRSRGFGLVVYAGPAQATTHAGLGTYQRTPGYGHDPRRP